jgi:hypothetical protein
MSAGVSSLLEAQRWQTQSSAPGGVERRVISQWCGGQTTSGESLATSARASPGLPRSVAPLSPPQARLRELRLQATGLPLGQVVPLALHVAQQAAALCTLLEAPPELVKGFTFTSDYVHTISYPQGAAASRRLTRLAYSGAGRHPAAGAPAARWPLTRSRPPHTTQREVRSASRASPGYV